MEKVLIVTPFFRPNIGGAETFAEDLAKALSKKYIVHICTIKWEKPIIWQGMDFKSGAILCYKLIGPLLKMSMKYKYSKIYALGLIPSFLCFLLRLKFNAVILALYDFKKPNFFRTILNRAEKIFVEGHRGKDDIFRLGVSEKKIVEFNHWVDQNIFQYDVRTNKRLKVLFVGRPIKIKGKHIIEECEKITEGIDYEYIENVPYSSLAKYYKMADVCVVPSLYSEGFSRVVVEAASCGCIVITSDRGSLPELVRDFGWYVEPTPQKFAETLNGLKVSRVFIESKQIRTALYAREHFGEKNSEVFL